MSKKALKKLARNTENKDLFARVFTKAMIDIYSKEIADKRPPEVVEYTLGFIEHMYESCPFKRDD